MAKPVQLKMTLCSLFTLNNQLSSRWGALDSHPVVNANVTIEGTKLSTVSGKYGYAQLDVSSLSSGDYVLALTPDADHLLKNSAEPVCPSDGNPKDLVAWCRYRPLRINVSIEFTASGVTVTGASPCEDATHGAALLRPAGLMIDWKPDWVVCKHSGERPEGIEPTLIVLHRTDAPTPGSSIDSFLKDGCSSHYLVDVDGHVIKLVHENHIANHAGTSLWMGENRVNTRSVGIEVVNKDGPFTLPQYEAVNRLVRQLRQVYPGIGRHGIVGHGEVQVRKDDGLKDYIKDIKEGKRGVVAHDLTLDSRGPCPGIYFDWSHLEEQGLCSKADASLFAEDEIANEYGGFFKDNPYAKLCNSTVDLKVVRRDGSPYGVISKIQSELASLGYSVSVVYGRFPNGIYDEATQRAVDRFRRRYVPGSVPYNDQVSSILDRRTAIALKRVLLDRQK